MKALPASLLCTAQISNGFTQFKSSIRILVTAFCMPAKPALTHAICNKAHRARNAKTFEPVVWHLPIVKEWSGAQYTAVTTTNTMRGEQMASLSINSATSHETRLRTYNMAKRIVVHVCPRHQVTSEHIAHTLMAHNAGQAVAACGGL